MSDSESEKRDCGMVLDNLVDPLSYEIVNY